MKPEVLVITGPTATGKTKLAVMTAKAIGGEVVGADSMQIYRHMDIGTAKPTLEEMEGIPHHMIDVCSPFEDYSVSRYVEEAAKCCEDIISRGKTPIIAGGTGLYIESLLSGRDFAPGIVGNEVREELSGEYDALGGEAMLDKLREIDPISGEKLHANDKKRIVRALEVYLTTGKTITQHNEETKAIPPRYRSRTIALTFKDRARLYDRIDRRVDMMLEMGLMAEIQKLLDMGLSETSTAMQAIGYKEIISAIKGECTLKEGIEAVKRESRRYAKRQLSWLRRDKSITWIEWDDVPNFDDALSVVM
ncbi:MAG: tRNA (adenosine(37)-N6)-dimethylallyltransferase MiaA [Ruminococcaceae bacterium]|nr:tRNA (adenosine(37)-N6)-dimethylallyltransferase MiaA [Oscillospiraceae bacterium]